MFNELECQKGAQVLSWGSHLIYSISESGHKGRDHALIHQTSKDGWPS